MNDRTLPEPLVTKLEQLPTNPGVYLMKDAAGEVIYIGKAVNLRSRVRSYFNATLQNHLANQLLRSKAHDLEWIVTDNEREALILEANLTKKHAPRYNINLKDDKHFPYIRITTSEPYPRILVTRRVNPRSKDHYFGPYTQVAAMRKTIRLLHKIFRIRDCNLKLPLDEPIKPCLSFHIKRCDAPCAFLTTEEDYRELVSEATLLLKGRHKELLQRLQDEMGKASSALRFEHAAKIRDQMQDLMATLEKQKMDLGADDVPKDIVAVARNGRTGCVVVLKVRDGYVSDRKHFEVSCPLEQNESEIITDFLKESYHDARRIPRELLLSHPLCEEENVEGLLREIRGGAVTIEVPQRGEKLKHVRLAEQNALLILAEFVGRKERKSRLSYMVMALQEDLGLEKPPKRIEGFDISHLSGTDTVASQVVFVDGKPLKKDYRHYNVKTVEGIDDFASMKEILTRRVKRLIAEEREFPDLFLIDGGKGQLRMAYQVLCEHGKEDQPVIGLAKRLEEIFFPGQSEPLVLPKNSPSLQLLQQVRDESHRFAVTFQRSKRKVRMERSWLDEVPGIGPKTKMKLLRHFKTVKAIQNAALDELTTVGGSRTAKAVKDAVESGEGQVEN